MKITFGNAAPVKESGKGWIKYAVFAGLIAIIVLIIFVGAYAGIIEPIMMSIMAMVLVLLYAGLLTVMGSTTNQLKIIIKAYRDMHIRIEEVTDVAKELHTVLGNVIRLAEYAPTNLHDQNDKWENDREEAVPNVEEWSLPDSDTVIPFDRRNSAG
jgi:hypothetical protein